MASMTYAKGQAIAELTAQLIRFPSISGQERAVVDFLAQRFAEKGWAVERIPVAPERENLFVSWGVPEIVFTTHVDIVAAPDRLFEPRFSEGRLSGRGACDAKGIAAMFISVCESLLEDGETNFGLLLVVGEEEDGAGARVAAQHLQGRGIRYLVNGEPTEGRVISAHKGGFGFRLSFTGKACHSGYPERGIDANAALIETAHDLLHADFGYDPVLGKATVNIGVVRGGLGDNIVSPNSTLTCLIRTVGPLGPVEKKAREIVEGRGEFEIFYEAPAMHLMKIAGMPSACAAFSTDIPYLAPLGAQAVLYGPGTILVAHTDEESITVAELQESYEGSRRIFEHLKALTRSGGDPERK